MTHFWELASSAGRKLLPVIGGILCCLLIFILHRGWTNSLSAIPGSWISRWTGAITNYYWFIGKRGKYVDSLHRRYGPIVRVSPTEIQVNDIPAVKQIHRIGGPYLKSDWYYELTTRDVETVLNTTNSTYHSRIRKLLSGPISDASLKHFEPIITDTIKLAIHRVGEEIEIRGAADIFKWATFLATDIIGELSFGESFKMLEHCEKNQYIKDLESLVSQQPFKTTFPFMVTAARYLNIRTFRQIAEVVDRLQLFAKESVKRYENYFVQNTTNPKPTLLSKLYKAEMEEGLSRKEIISNSQAYIVAGSDTTAMTLTYMIYAVCKDPKIRDQLSQEVKSLPEDFADKHCRDLKFLNQVINETLRAYPVVSTALPRIVPPQGVVLAGYHIPGGITVATQAYSLHRNPEVFAAPEKFNPSRWEKPTKEMKESFMPFGGGSRNCLGMHLAKIELRLASAHFFRRFPNARVSSKEGMSDDDME